MIAYILHKAYLYAPGTNHTCACVSYVDHSNSEIILLVAFSFFYDSNQSTSKHTIKLINKFITTIITAKTIYLFHNIPF